MPEFEVTLLTTRCGTSVAHIIAASREAALSIVRAELAGGDYVAAHEHCTDDIQIEVWAITESQVKEVRDACRGVLQEDQQQADRCEPQRCPL